MKPTTLADCMGVFDWFDDPMHEYIAHILISKADGEARVQHALGSLLQHATRLIQEHSDTELAYPTEPLLPSDR